MRIAQSHFGLSPRPTVLGNSQTAPQNESVQAGGGLEDPARIKSAMERHAALTKQQEFFQELLLASNQMKAAYTDYLVGSTSTDDGRHRSYFYWD